MKINGFLQNYLRQHLKDLINTCCGQIEIRLTCCDDSKKWTLKYVKDSQTKNLTNQLKNKHISTLNFFSKRIEKKCCLNNKVITTDCCDNNVFFKIIED